MYVDYRYIARQDMSQIGSSDENTLGIPGVVGAVHTTYLGSNPFRAREKLLEVEKEKKREN